MEKSRHYATLLLITLFVTYLSESFLRRAASSLTPLLIEELSLSHSAMGFMISVLSMVYGLMQIPSGLLSERLGARKAILYFTVLTIIGALLFWSGMNYNTLLVGQFLIGLGCSTFYINAVKLVAKWFPSDKKATAIGVLSASGGLANFIAYNGFPKSVELFGSWRPIYLVVGGVLVASWVANMFIIKDGGSSEIASEAGAPPLREVLVDTLKDKRLYPFIAGYLLSTTAWVYFTWMPQFMIDVRGLSYIEVGQIASMGSIAGIPGSIVISAISDKLKKRKVPLVLFSGLAAVLVFGFLALPASTPLWVFVGLNFFIGFCFSFWVLLFSMVPETLPPRQASIGLGLVNGMGTIGFSFFAPLYGYLVDLTGAYTASNYSIQFLILLMPVIFYVFIKECYGGIQEK